MAINLFNNPYNNIQNSQTQTQANAGALNVQSGSVMQKAAMAMLNELRNIMPGDTLSGQLVSKDGSSIGLLLNNNLLLNTVLDQDVNIGIGTQVSFEVKSNHDGQLTLRPMFTNLNNSPTITNALNSAGIPIGDSTIEMVDSLMKNAMPINKEMLTTINREMTQFPDADVKDIVMLHKMDIPVTEANIRQMELYRGNNQWMMENVEESAGQLTDLLTDVIAGEGDQTAILNELKEVLLPAGEDVGKEILENPVANEEAISGDGEKASNLKGPEVKDINKEIQTSVDVKDLENEENKELSANNINKFNVFDKLQNMDKETVNNPLVKQQVNKALNELLKDNFLMNPKDIAEDKFVKRYYEKTMDLANQLSRILNENGKADTDFSRTVTNLKENTNFMNQVNELYNYVQLPLKMNDTQANGDLYVYARKKGRGAANEDGKLTALLHLSMEHLGNMDIFLTLKDGQNLSTKFTLEKEEMIDFIESHIDELNNRLIKKGYNIGTTFVGKKDEDETNVIENIVKGDNDNILLSTQSFDARA